MPGERETDHFGWQQSIIRIYVNGFVALAICYLIWKFLIQNSPWSDVVENPFAAAALTVVTILLVPPLLGSLVQFAILPVLGRWRKWNEITFLHEKVVGDLSKSDPPIVLIDWPSQGVRTMGVVTSFFSETETNKELAAVYVPMAPGSKSGYIRVVAKSDLAYTGWSLKEFQFFQFSLGALSPTAMKKLTELQPGS
jgi:uncharacterized membrane protein